MGDSRRWQAAEARIITSGGRSIPAHCSILASASPVLESLLDRTPTKRGVKSIPILGVPCDSIEAFLRLLYSPPRRVTEEAAEGEMGRYGMHLLVLSHVYRVGWVKRACEAALAAGLTADVVVDVLQLARQCDAPRLYLTCMKLIAKDFSAVEQSEAWGFVKARDPGLVLEIIRFQQDADLRLKRRRRMTMEQGLYEQLSEAMECLQHICTEGCTDVGPHDKQPPNKSKAPCTSFQTCRSLQLLIRHFAACHHKRVCPRCKRMRQLFRLHSSICDQPEPCKVPFCRQFKERSQQIVGKGGDEERWMLLAKKVASVKAVSSLAKRKRDERSSQAIGWV